MKERSDLSRVEDAAIPDNLAPVLLPRVTSPPFRKLVGYGVDYGVARKPWPAAEASMYTPTRSPRALFPKALVNVEPGTSIVVRTPWASRYPWVMPAASS